MDGGGVSAATIEVLLQNLINVFKEEGSVLREFDEDAKKLQKTLKTIQGCLNGAEEKSINDEAVQIWLRKLEALAFDADNDLDKLSYHLLHNKMETEKAAMSDPKKKETEVLSVFSSLNLISRRQLNPLHTIKQINTCFENMNKSATELKLQYQSTDKNAPAAAAAQNASDSSLDPNFIGKDDGVEMLTQTQNMNKTATELKLQDQSTDVNAPAAAALNASDSSPDPICIGKDDGVPKQVEMLTQTQNMNERATELKLQDQSTDGNAPAAAALNASGSSPDPICIVKDDGVPKQVEMLTQTQNMNERATELKLEDQSTDENASAAAALNASDSSLDPTFIGKDDDVTKLVGMLTQTHPQERIFSILALVGKAGMGKTTLIKKVFNHKEIKDRFGSHIWVHVSQTFDPIIVFNKILSTLTSHVGGALENGEVILIKLQEALQSKTYLLVLDDVWNEDVSKWEAFINGLSAVTSTEGNGIIITTRNEKVASVINPPHIHLLKRLSNEDCWSIIRAKAFEEREASSEFETTGIDIAERCQGSALAANLVGGVLRGKSKEEWLKVKEKWLPEDDISKILRLSYANLSSASLKKCFTYCSIFPKGRRIVKQELIELWMAEGFLQPNGRDDMESVGDMFFNMLLQNSLLQVAERDDIGNVESCVMHDLVHDLASSVLGSSNVADGGTKIRYMILKEEANGIPKEVAKHLRTLFVEGEIHCINMFSDFQSLHNLTLTRVEELPSSIRKLIHLRNLNISKACIRELPKWISELHHLQTLRAYTKDMWQLPIELNSLTNLRHLYIFSHVKLPAMMRRLTSLQTLRHFAVGGNEGYKIEELGTLINLKGELRISNLEKVKGKEEADTAKIFEKPNLFDLRFEWDYSREGERNVDESVLEGLQPHANANLKKLEIDGFKGKRFPEWIEKMAVWDGPQASWLPLQNLRSIKLKRCSECQEIPELEHLPNLKSLSLKALKKVRFINSSFSKLMSLKIGDLEGLECLPDWLFYKNQNLSKLEIRQCPKLIKLPDGLDTHNSLEELSIRDCRNLMWKGLPQGMRPSVKLKIEGCGRMVEEPMADASEKIQPSDIKDCPDHSDWPKEFIYKGTSSAAIKVLLQNIINVAPIRDFDAKQLQETVGYLDDAEKKSITQEGLIRYLRMLEAMAFHADHVVDEVVKKSKTRHYNVLSYFSFLNHISFRRRNMPRITSDFVYMNFIGATFLGLEKSTVENAPPPPPHASFDTNSFPLDPIFIGRGDNVRELVDKLTNIPEEQIFSILAIHGVGGVGKTMLTRNVLNDKHIKARFGSQIWVLVPRIFDPIMLLRKILSALLSRSTTSRVENEESILKQLKEALKGKTYLLVLDDVWNEDPPKWKKFINSIRGVTSTKGNAVIITTRKDEVASMVALHNHPIHNHPLKGLSDEECWSIIEKKTFGNGVVPQEFERKVWLRKICLGLPLIANVVGGMLRDGDWHSKIQTCERCHMFDFLRLSYDNLSSPSLKMCFTYCSIFPKGHRIVKQELIELWMAEGFLQPNQRDDMESVGDMFFNILVHNSLLQVAEKNDIGDVESCMMHDLVHDLASAVSRSSYDDTNQVRYLFHADSSPIPEETANLRTLIFQGTITDTNMFESFKSLHALTLDCDEVTELPNSIRKLIHLRKLNISRTQIKYLPDWICELSYLQALNALTESLRKLPSKLKCLISLRHLYIQSGVKLPPEIGALTNLQALKFRVGEEKGYKIEELGSLNNLRHLSIYNLEEVCDEEEARKANISQKLNLSELSFNFEWAKREGERDDKSVLEGLQPHAEASIKKLEIRGFTGKRFPEWTEKMMASHNQLIVIITLAGCKGCESIPALGQLPNLKSLSLGTLSNVTSIYSLYGNDINSDRGDIFPALETLSLTDMGHMADMYWEEVELPSEVKVFRRLQSLKIYRCDELKCLPRWLFSKAHDLKELDIRHCSKLSNLPNGLYDHASLESMTIKGCQNLNSILDPDSRGSLTSLRSLEILHCPKLKTMVEPSEIPLLQKVYMVELKSLQNLHKFLDCLEKSPLLSQLTIVGVSKFIYTPDVKKWPFRRLQKLEIDLATEWSRETSVTIEEIVNNILKSCSSSLGELILTGIEIWKCMPESIRDLQGLYNLELENFGVKELPNWFEHFSSLERLCLSTFTKLRRLPSMKSLTGLQEFHIRNCPKLRIENEGHKIFHRCTTYVNGHSL